MRSPVDFKRRKTSSFDRVFVILENDDVMWKQRIICSLVRVLLSLGSQRFYKYWESSHMINIQWTKFEEKSIVSFISEEWP